MESSRFLAILHEKDNTEEGYGIMNFVVVWKHARRRIAHRSVSVAAVARPKDEANKADETSQGSTSENKPCLEPPFLQTPMFQRLDIVRRLRYDAISCYEHR
jgi:hypothetical protein